MSDEWMPTLKMNLSRQEFDQLPRHPAFKYELIGGVAYISPWPRNCHAELRLMRFKPAGAVADVQVRPVAATDIDALVPILVGAFSHAQPFGSLQRDAAQRAAEKSLGDVFAGKEGPMVGPASFVAMEDGRICGAILITLLPGGDPAEFDSYEWPQPPPADLWDRRQGQPHLTWIFVSKFAQGIGIGTRLLQEAAQVLRKAGYARLWSTFMIGNDSSMRWHWRNGFVLAEGILSKRRMRRELGR